MSFTIILFIIVHLVALIYFVEVLRRVFKKAREYTLKDTPVTLPFGFIRLRHVAILYVLSYLIWVVASILLYLYFIEPSGFSLGGSSGSVSNSVILDL